MNKKLKTVLVMCAGFALGFVAAKCYDDFNEILDDDWDDGFEDEDEEIAEDFDKDKA